MRSPSSTKSPCRNNSMAAASGLVAKCASYKEGPDGRATELSSLQAGAMRLPRNNIAQKCSVLNRAPGATSISVMWP